MRSWTSPTSRTSSISLPHVRPSPRISSARASPLVEPKRRCERVRRLILLGGRRTSVGAPLGTPARPSKTSSTSRGASLSLLKREAAARPGRAPTPRARRRRAPRRERRPRRRRRRSRRRHPRIREPPRASKRPTRRTKRERVYPPVARIASPAARVGDGERDLRGARRSRTSARLARRPRRAHHHRRRGRGLLGQHRARRWRHDGREG